jgi:hypothetical protein
MSDALGRENMNRTTPTVVTAFCAMLLSHAYAEWRFDGETGAFYDSNLSNADRSSDVRDDWAWKSDVSVNNGFQLTRDLRLNIAGDLRGELWDRFGSFNEIGLGALAGLRYRFGLGRQAPWVMLENRFGYDRFQDTERSGYDEEIGLRSGISLSDRVALEAGYSFENYAVPDTFYDRQAHHGSVRVIIDPTSFLRVAVGYDYREGDVISYAAPPRPDIRRLSVEEREDDATFGSDPLFTAYKLLGQTHSVSISAAYVLNQYASVEVDYEYAVTIHDPLQYENNLVAAKVLFTY